MSRISPEKQELLSQVRHPDSRNFSFPVPGLSPGLHTPFAVQRYKVKESSRPGEEESRERPGTDGPLERRACPSGREETLLGGGLGTGDCPVL